MGRKDMRPVAYVPREIRAFGDGAIDRVVGYFVAKAYVNQTLKEYDKDGKLINRYYIEFVGDRERTFEMYMSQEERGVFAVEEHNADFKSKKWAFGNFKACKKCVCELNTELAEDFRDSINRFGANDRLKLWINLHKQARKFGKKLEETYITEQERQEENTINF